MAKKPDKLNPSMLASARTQANWEAQGWASEAEAVTAASRLETTITICFDPENAALLRQAARLKGLARSQFVREAAIEKARKTLKENPFGLLAQDAIAQYQAGQTRSLEAFAEEMGYSLDDE